MRRLLAILCFAYAGCANAHYAPCEFGSCPTGSLCDSSPTGDYCVPTCSIMRDVFLCDGGEGCFWRPGGFRCSAGGTIGPDQIVDPFGVDTCVFGYVPGEDYTSDPLVHRCREGCDRDLDCPMGFRCASAGCAPICALDHEVCGTGNTCVTVRGTPYCVNARRFARIDCDGDGMADCPPFGQCDSAAVGGCGPPPLGER